MEESRRRGRYSHKREAGTEENSGNVKVLDEQGAPGDKSQEGNLQ